ncbi:ribonuclease HI family protein [Facklamia miroungae]|uniref:Ribonuclease HI n=1 Tax=Facklamia miroungae TaxID=120956 RepID=A0A1G7QYS0_9LACT|nr:ribonuclease HI family protein [Facklamia miroungae]NKZ29114.1 ribonuclease HI family protein [Facklamia miroungae]SDG03645.1 ribonuclease HI [Facklamia miroungae]
MWIQIDAAFDPKTKEAGLAFLVFDKGNVDTHKFFLAKITDNHLAEFISLLLAMQWLKQQNLKANQLIQIKTDSKIVFQSINKQYAKKEHFKVLLTTILNEMNKYPLLFLKWIPEKENRAADQAAKQALHKQGQVSILDSYLFFDQY